MRVINAETIVALTDKDRKYFLEVVEILEDFKQIMKQSNARHIDGNCGWTICNYEVEEMIKAFETLSKEQYLGIE